MSGGEKNTVPHVVNPIYALSNHDGLGAKVTHVEFNGTNYTEWSNGFRNALGAKRKVGFITGTVKAPASDSADYDDWYMANCTIIAWIFNTIALGLRSTISYRPTAYELWEAIRRRFSVGNEVKLYHLYSDLVSCKQQSDESVMAYFGRIKPILDTINDYDPLDVCDCSGCTCKLSDKLSTKRERAQIRSFLMGLEPYFQPVRSQILATTPAPSLEDVYSRVIQEEDARPKSAAAPPMAFVVRSSGTSESKPPRQGRRTCTFCKRLGHVEDTCWEKHGYPEGRGPKRSNPRPAVTKPTSGLSPNPVNAILGPYLEDEDWCG